MLKRIGYGGVVATGLGGMSQTAAAKTCNCDEIEPEYKPHVSDESESISYNYKAYTETAAILFEACKAGYTDTWDIWVTFKSNSWTKATEGHSQGDEGDYVKEIYSETVTLTYDEIDNGSVEQKTYGDWLGAYKFPDGEEDPSWGDLIFRSAEYVAGFVPWIGDAYSTADYLDDMYGGVSEKTDEKDKIKRYFKYTGYQNTYNSKAGSVVKYRFNMEPGASMECTWNHELNTSRDADNTTSISFTVDAPDEHPDNYC